MRTTRVYRYTGATPGLSTVPHAVSHAKAEAAREGHTVPDGAKITTLLSVVWTDGRRSYEVRLEVEEAGA